MNNNIEYKKNDITKEANNINENNEFNLINIESPYELILHLIEKANLLKNGTEDIMNVNLSEITGEYLHYIEQMEILDLQLASEFIEIASTLIELKSKTLLPKQEDDEFDDLEEKQRHILTAAKEYKLFKEASYELQLLEDTNKFYKNEEPECKEYKIILKQMNIENLINAFTSLMQKFNENSLNTDNTKLIERDRWTVEDKMFEIETILISANEINFFDLIEDDYSKSEIINLFLALLELIKLCKISIMQNNHYENIYITKNKEEQND